MSEQTRSPFRDQQQLRKKARDYVIDYPDLHAMAKRAAQSIIFKRTGKRLEPHDVYWHRFSSAASSPRTFTGWEHIGRPVESMTIVELVIRRFSAQDQVATDELSAYGGFYTAKAEHGVFNETNEVPLLAQDVLNDFWALDFSAGYYRKLEHFWRVHGETFCSLAKAEYLAAAGRSVRDRHLSIADFELLTQAIGSREAGLPSLTSSHGQLPAADKATIHWLDLGGLKARNILRIVVEPGVQILYIPGDTQAFYRFTGPQQLYDWLRMRLGSVVTRTQMRRHFLRASLHQTSQTVAFDLSVGSLLAHDWVHGHGLVNQIEEAIPCDAFDYLRDNAKEEMTADARVLLTSNAQLRKQVWMGYLDAFLRIAGNISLLGWPLALSVVGAATVNIGLNFEQAFVGKTDEQRKAGVLGAICNAIYLAFNLPLLTGAGSVAADMTATAASHPSSVDVLANLNGNQVLVESVAPVATSGRLRGIFQVGHDETWIQMNELPYRVRFNESQHHWQVIDPHNPFAFSSGPAVALDAQGLWRPLATPGLSGGAPQDIALEAAGHPVSRPYGNVGSTFWDHYMLINVYDERSVAEAAIARQEEVMDIFRMEPGEEVVSDSEGEDVHVDLWGAKHRVFKTPDAMFHAQSIRRYTVNGSVYNQYLRTGTAFEHTGQPGMMTLAEQVEDIKRFVEDIGTLGFNNNVALYRGGSGNRSTSGLFFRSGSVEVGDVLVNTDITSFSENPYQSRTFASSQAGDHALSITAPVTFDDTSVVFELPAQQYLHATPIAPFSSSPDEAESIFLPGRYFRIDQLDEVQGTFYRFMRVRISEIASPVAGRKLLDMRTGESFSREQYAARLGVQGKPLVDVFFPEVLSGQR